MRKIYFDYASTTPTDPEVITAMEPYFFERFGNPSSPHGYGREAQKVLEEAREQIACFIGARPEEIIFTSGATESNNQAILSVARQLRGKGDHILASAIEHHSVHEPLEALRKEGFRITYLDVDAQGGVDPESVQRAIEPKTTLLAVLYASNEIGTIQPIAEIGKIAKGRGVPFLVDAVQAVGHIPVNVQESGADFLSLSAHKFYGPKGTGALYVRSGSPVLPLLLGGDQERSRRASTQNVAGAVGMAKAAEICSRQMAQEARTQQRWRDRLLEEVPQRITGVKVNGHLTQRLPSNVHFAFEGLTAESLLMILDMTGIAASMGSACTAGAMAPSHVLKAIGLSDELAFGALRISLGRWTTEDQIDYFLEELPGIVAQLRV